MACRNIGLDYGFATDWAADFNSAGIEKKAGLGKRLTFCSAHVFISILMAEK